MIYVGFGAAGFAAFVFLLAEVFLSSNCALVFI